MNREALKSMGGEPIMSARSDGLLSVHWPSFQLCLHLAWLLSLLFFRSAAPFHAFCGLGGGGGGAAGARRGRSAAAPDTGSEGTDLIVLRQNSLEGALLNPQNFNIPENPPNTLPIGTHNLPQTRTHTHTHLKEKRDVCHRRCQGSKGFSVMVFVLFYF